MEQPLPDHHARPCAHPRGGSSVGDGPVARARRGVRGSAGRARPRRGSRLPDRLTFDLTKDLGYRYPGAEDAGAERRLAELCGARLEDRYGLSAIRAEAQARLAQELHVIGELGLAGFFLLHHDMLELAREVA